MTGLENLTVRVWDKAKKIYLDYTLLELMILLADELEKRANDETKNLNPASVANPGSAHAAISTKPTKERM